MDDKTFPGPIKISLATAKEWEKKYDGDTTVGDAKNKMKAFLIPRESLENVLALKTEAIRAYIGINDKDEKILFFVGADKDEKSGQYTDVYGRKTLNYNLAKGQGDEDEEEVYNGTRPSPPF